ncbi:DNA-binding protein [Nocardia terpenica]|uniref:DNA-binding protein n=1 Tax=Nocardia terpenica TaxID=455432 RepID=UPI002FE32471
MKTTNAGRAARTVARREPLAVPKEVAEYLRTSVEALAQMRHRRIGPPYRKLNGRVYYDWADVYSWVDASTVRSTDKGVA